MKKILLASLALMLLLVGCSSTSPALKDAWLNNLLVDSVESKMVLKIDLQIPDQITEAYGSVDEEVTGMVSELLKSGIIIEQKTTKEQDIYVKFSFVDPAPLKNSKYWKSDKDPFLEIFAKDDEIYARTSSEDRYIKISPSDPEFAAYLAGSFDSKEMTAKLKGFFADTFRDYLDQFNFNLRKIEDRGFVNVTTPEGTQSVKQIHVELTVDDIISFVSYFLGNLAEYDGLKPMAKEFSAIVEGDSADALTDEELDAEIEDFRNFLLDMKAELDQYNEQKIEEETGANVDFLTQADLYLTPDAHTVGANVNIDLGVSQPILGDVVKLKLNIETQNWNINQDVSLPEADFANALSIEDLTDRTKIKQLGDHSIIRFFAEQYLKRTGNVTIGDGFATVGNEIVYLDEPPYITTNNNTMIPVKFISKVADTEPVWNQETHEITFTANGNEVVVRPNDQTAIVNGAKVQMPEQAVIKNGRTFVPLRFVVEKLGAKVTWDQETQEITIEFD
ncbi:MAG TPA: copper amine oxidase N-terminal domain-containing protein [Bacilli bacterium]